MPFSQDFVWGAATSAYQIEGAWKKEGKGLSVWDVFSHTPGKVWSGNNGDTACDHYHHYEQDVQIMKDIGLRSYRFSIAWSRVLPEGVGQVNPAGLDFYDRLVDSLLKANIVPYATLFHWDFPIELYYRGGWLNRDSADWFADYATTVVKKLGDRIKHWMTLNEPAVFINLGHHVGIHAPGDKLPAPHVLRIAHNALRGHGKAVQAIRAESPSPCSVGIAPDLGPAIPNTESTEDIDAARNAIFKYVDKNNFWAASLWYDPPLLGRYSDEVMQTYSEDMPEIKAGDMETIHQPLDFLGVNIYRGMRIHIGKNGMPEPVGETIEQQKTLFEWSVTPEALYWGPKFLYERYKLPIYITENGLSNVDWVGVDGKVHDPQRIDFLTRYLRNLKRAAAEGVDVRGYFHWSLLDNFEWGEGMKQRFGMVYVNFETQERILKDSAYWYQDVISTNGENLG